MISTYLPVQAQNKAASTIKEQMEFVHKTHKVNFIYDSSLNLNHTYEGKTLQGLNLELSLRELFKKTDIKWEVRGKYVLLKKKKSFTASGYVFQENGEPLINATIKDMELGVGTLSNEFGFFSITLPEDKRIPSYYLRWFWRKDREYRFKSK